ncbi:MAG: tetratricopeptide repeat protein, partial [Acidobacteriota bacterium]
LYELLTDRRPHRVAGRSPAAVEREVCRTEPPWPSAAVGGAGGADGGGGPGPDAPGAATAAAIGAARRTTPAKLRRRLRGDLDKIVMAALRKEPSRRYPSVEAMAEDLRRHLDGRPVSARRDTARYRVGKFVRRHRLGVAAAAAVAVLVVGFGVAMAVQAARIAEHARALEAERDRVRLQMQKATRVQGLVSDLFKAMGPGQSGGASSEQLHAASHRMVADLADEPELQVELMDEILTIYSNLGLYEDAAEMAAASLEVRRRAFPSERRAIAWGLLRLGEAHFLNSRFADARARYEEALEIQRAELGPDHLDIAASLIRLSRLHRNDHRIEEAAECAEAALDILGARHGEVHPD